MFTTLQHDPLQPGVEVKSNDAKLTLSRKSNSNDLKEVSRCDCSTLPRWTGQPPALKLPENKQTEKSSSRLKVIVDFHSVPFF